MDINLQTLDQVEAAQMTPEEFASYAIVVGVTPHEQPHLRGRLQLCDSQDDQLQALRDELRRRLPLWRRGLSDSERAHLEQRFLDRLLDVPLQGHGCCNRILGGRALVVARADLLERHGRRAVAQAAHRHEVAQAVADRRPVNSETALHYGLAQPSNSAQLALQGAA